MANTAPSLLGTIPHVLFRLGKQAFAMPLAQVKDVARSPHITAVPNATPMVRGVTVLRDQLAPVLDMRVRFGLPASLDASRATVLAVDHEGERVGLLIDRVEDVLMLPPSLPSAHSKDPLWQGVVAGVVQREADTVLVLDVAAILDGALRR